MGTYPILTAMTFHRCSEADFEKTAVRDDFASYDFRTCDLYGLEEETILAAKWVRGGDGASSSIVLPAAPSFSREGVKCSLLKPIRRDYEMHRRKTEGFSAIRGREDEEGLNLDELLEKDLLWAETEDHSDVAKETLVAKRILIKATGH